MSNGEDTLRDIIGNIFSSDRGLAKYLERSGDNSRAGKLSPLRP